MSNGEKNNTNSHSNSAQNEFDGKLQELIKQIESIRKIKMITESEYGSILLMKEELSNKQNEIEGLKKENDVLKKDKREKDDLNDEIKELKDIIQAEKLKREKRLWWTIWIILGVFTLCAIWLLMKTPFICDNECQIPLLVGGMFVLLFLVVIVIFLGKTIRQVIVNTNKEEL